MDYSRLKMVSLRTFIYQLSCTLHLKDRESSLLATISTSLPSIRTRGCALIRFSTLLLEIIQVISKQEPYFSVYLQIKSTAMFCWKADTFAFVI